MHTGTAAMNLHLRAGLLALLLVGGFGIAPIRAETPEEWIKLGARVHGGFGSFIPVGIRIGEDAMKRLSAQPRELSVLYYSGESVPCPCSVDGVMLAVSASPGQGSVQVAAEKSPPGTFAVVVIRPRKGGNGLKYTVPMCATWPSSARSIAPCRTRSRATTAVMGISDLFVVEPETKLSPQ